MTHRRYYMQGAAGITYSAALQTDNPYLHIFAFDASNFTLAGNDITQADSVGVATYNLTNSPNSPSLDQVNKWINFDKSNTEGLINDSIGVDKFKGNDLPFSCAFVVKVNTIDSNFYMFWSASENGNTQRQAQGIFSIDFFFNQRREGGSSINNIDATSAIIQGSWYIITMSFSGTTITGYKNGVKIFNNAANNKNALNNISKFSIGYIRRDTNVNFIDADIKEFAFFNTEVSDVRLQAWNTDLNSTYSIY